MSYKILNFDKDTGRITIKYDEYQPINLVVPVDNEGNVSVGEQFEAWVMQMRPNFELMTTPIIKNSIKNADTILARVESIIPSDPILDQTLEEAKRYSKQEIDIRVSRIRPLFMTNINGQSLTYYIKIEQAKAFKANGYSGIVPSYIKAESDLTLKTPQETADTIINAAGVFNDDILPRLEAIRVAGKASINAATNVQEVDASYRKTGMTLALISKEIDTILNSQSNDVSYVLSDV